MTSILNLESSAPLEDEPALAALPETSDYEVVLGRSQIASWLFVGLIAVAVSSSLAYLLGETVGVKKTARASAATRAAIPVPAAPAAAPSAPIPEASILVPSIAKPKSAVAAPLFAEPETGKVYLQIGAVERGMAMLLAEGLRSHGFDSFVAPGPHANLFRVLIGPLPDPQTFRQAMAAVEALDLAVYARKYQK